MEISLQCQGLPEPLRCTFLLSCCTCKYLLIPVLVTLRSNTWCVRQTCRISIKTPRYSPSLPGLPQKHAHVVKIPLSSKSYIIPQICGRRRGSPWSSGCTKKCCCPEPGSGGCAGLVWDVRVSCSRSQGLGFQACRMYSFLRIWALLVGSGIH